MVFWSSWAKKVRESINKLTFDKLKSRVDIIENDYATKTYTDAQDTTLSNKITANTNRIVRIETELGDANFVLYMGPWSATDTYKKGLAVTEGDLWYVSNVNNNINHRPSGVSDQYWKLITSPSINLNDYYTKAQVDSFVRQLDNQIDTVNNSTNQIEANLANNYYTKTQSDQNYTSFATGLQLRNDVSANTTAINSQANILSRKADTSYVEDRAIIKYWAAFPSTTIGRGTGKQFRINGLPRYLNFINAQVQEGITENSDYLHSNIIWYIGDRELQIDTQYDYNSSACFVYIRNKSNYDINIGGQYDAIGSLTLYFTRNVVRGGNITITA